MRHGVKYYGSKTTTLDGIQIRHQIEFYTFHGVWQHQRMNRQNDNQHDQNTHHDFHDFFHTALQAKCTDSKSNQNRQNHPANHRSRRSQHIGKCCSNFICRHGCQFSAGAAVNVKQHPSADHGVKHHQQIVSENRKPFKMMPFGSCRF